MLLSLRFLFGDPFIRAGLEKIEGKRSAVEHLVVEGADVELWSQLCSGAFAQFAELELAEFVTQACAGQAM